MIENDFCNLIQNTVDDLITSLNLNNLKVKVCNELNYSFVDGDAIVANVMFGTAKKEAEEVKMYSMPFSIEITSEKNGFANAKLLFNNVFTELTLTEQTLGDYATKIELSAPLLTQAYNEIENGYNNTMYMFGNVTFSKDLIIGSTWQYKLSSGDFVDFKPINPTVERVVTATSDNYLNGDNKTVIQGVNNSIHFTLICEDNNLCNQVLSDIHNRAKNKYNFQKTINGNTYTYNDMALLNANDAYDNNSGITTLTVSFAKGV